MPICLYNYAPVLQVNVSRPHFSTGPQGARERFGIWGRDYFLAWSSYRKWELAVNRVKSRGFKMAVFVCKSHALFSYHKFTPSKIFRVLNCCCQWTVNTKLFPIYKTKIKPEDPNKSMSLMLQWCQLNSLTATESISVLKCKVTVNLMIVKNLQHSNFAPYTQSQTL